MTGQEVDSVELPADIFAANVNRGLMHQAMVRQMANARRGTHQAKSRGEVARTTAKVYRQKGTGNARHGSRRAPIFVGGGVAHGPKPRSYVKNMPRKMRRAALRSALTAKASSGDIVILDDLALETPKTREMAAVIGAITGGQSALVLLTGKDNNVELSARNLQDVKTLLAGYLNLRDLLGHRKLVMPLSALEAVKSHLSTGAVASDEEE
jgi:large subunit ribosomal protein L4